MAPPTAARTPIAVVDYRKSHANKSAFVRDVFDALAGTGFMLLDGVDGLEDAVQQGCFKVAHDFFQLDTATKQRYSLCDNPHFRGWGSPGGTTLGGAAMVEAFQLGAACEPVAPHDDRSCPLWQRMLRGPNVWPSEADAPGFRSTLGALHARYFSLSRELGHVLCEALGVTESAYDSFFDLDDPDLLAALNHNRPLNEIPKDMRSRVIEAFAPGNEGAGLGYGASGHVDGAPFVTLLVADSPGLQVLALDGESWVDVTPGPGQVVVNIGATLSKLSNKRLRATVHRVNPLLQTRRRCSLPYFLLPKLEGELVPFGAEPTGRTRDRGLAYAVDRCNLWGAEAYERWYGEEVEEARQRMADELAAYKRTQAAAAGPGLGGERAAATAGLVAATAKL